ncbi:hypothetical protein M1615_04025 [Patescibacteria group bacterium]|nr:hypothetical protein [Patescibacteria group bacterium]
MTFLRKNWPYFLIIILSFPALLPLFHPGFFPIHDNEQIGRLFELNKTVAIGQIPPRLAPDLGFGYDYPLWDFYPPLVYYIGLIFHFLGFGYIVSTKIMIGIGLVGAGLTMYLFAKEYLPKAGALVSSIAYVYAPYHSVDLYVRGALPEFWSFVFVPLLFWSFLKIYKTQKTVYTALAGIFIGLTILTHDLIAMMSSVFLGMFVVYLFFQSLKKKTFIINTAIAGFLGFCLSSYFWLPSILEKKYTMVKLLTEQLANYGLHFVCIRQFWNSPWGYGGSILGCSDGLSFQIGKAQLLLAGAALTLFLLKIWQSKKIRHEIFLLFLGMFFISLFLQVTRSKFIWDHFQPFWYIQFPWRFLLFSDFTASFLAGFLFIFIKNAVLRRAFAVLALIFLLCFNLGYFRPQSYLNVSDNYYTNNYFLRFVTSSMSFEFMPRGIATVTSPIGNSVPDIKRDKIAKGDFSVISGSMKVKVLQSKTWEKKFLVDVGKNGIFQINVFSFPGWKVYLNKRPVRYYDDNKLRLIRLILPRGKYVVNAVFGETLVRKIGDAVSLFSLICVVLLLKLSFKYAKRK